MSGNPDNVHVWDNADVYVSFDLDATNPATAETPFGVDWELVGVLKDDSSFTTKYDEDQADVPSWNAGRVRRTYRNATLSKSFVAIEWNDTVRRLINRGEYDDDVLVIPSGPPERVKVGFLKIDGDQVHVDIYDEAEVVVDGDIDENGKDPTAYGFVAHIFGDDDQLAGEHLNNTSGS